MSIFSMRRRHRAASFPTLSTTARPSATVRASSPISSISIRLTIDATLTASEHRLNLLVARLLDDLYWVMSYSRWKDERFWPLFQAALLREHPSLTEAGLVKAREFNAQRYYFQGIGRYTADAAYARGFADLAVLDDIVSSDAYVHGEDPTSVDAGIYGFIANIHFFDIETPLKQMVSSRPKLLRHCLAVHAAVMQKRG
jgi:glutathione S-transferase